MSPQIQSLTSFTTRFRFSTKFAMAGAAMALLVGWLSFLVFSSFHSDIRVVQEELEGAEYTLPLRDAIYSLQQFRGLSASLKPGDEEQLKLIDTKRQAFEQAWSRLQEIAKAHDNRYLETGLAGAINESWQEIKSPSGSEDAAARFAKHSALIAKLFDINNSVNEKSGLILDPQAASYYMMSSVVLNLLPATERLGRVRGTGAKIIASGVFDGAAIASVTQQYGAGLLLTENAKANWESTWDYDSSNIDQAKQLLNQLHQEVADVGQEIKTRIIGADATADPKAFFTQASRPLDTISQLIDIGHKNLVHLLQERLKRTQLSERLMILAIVLLIVPVALFFWAINQAILNSVGNVQEVADAYAAGDYRQTAEVHGKDELATIAASMNRIGSSMRNLVQNITREAHEVTSHSRQLSSASSHLAQSVDEQNDATNSMAAVADEIASSLQSISDHTRDALNLTREAGRLSSEGQSAVLSTATEISSISRATQEVTTLMNSLTERSADIATILSTIQEISNQTNLLSLNAAIEAARAGESGKGFAVVADEVRRLAERAHESTTQIAAVLAQIESDTQLVSDRVQGWQKQSEEGVAVANRAAALIDQIGSGSDQVVREVEEVTHAIDEHTVAARRITENVEKVAAMSESNASAVHQIARSTTDLTTMAQRLQALVAQFRTH